MLVHHRPLQLRIVGPTTRVRLSCHLSCRIAMAETSRHDDADSHVLRSRSSGAVARIWGVPLCGVSSGCGEFRGWLGVVECAVADHGVQGQDAAVGQGEDGLVMTLALGSFALVISP